MEPWGQVSIPVSVAGKRRHAIWFSAPFPYALVFFVVDHRILSHQPQGFDAHIVADLVVREHHQVGDEALGKLFHVGPDER